jgi:hypothetical protein
MNNRYSGSEFAENIQLFNANLHLPTIKPTDNIAQVISDLEDRDIVQSLTPDMIDEYIITLNMYSWFLQQESNKLRSKIVFYKSNLDNVVGKNLGETPYSFFTEKRLYIIANNDTAQNYDKHLLELESQLAIISMYDKQISNLCESLRNLRFSRKQVVGVSM